VKQIGVLSDWFDFAMLFWGIRPDPIFIGNKFFVTTSFFFFDHLSIILIKNFRVFFPKVNSLRALSLIIKSSFHPLFFLY
jgi:hypothetical protein